MQIDSVRELKTMCFRQHVEPLTATPQRLPALALGARSVKMVDTTQRTIALGIARKSERDFQLAVRIQSRALEGGPYIKSILEKAKGEADVRYIGRLVK